MRPDYNPSDFIFMRRNVWLTVLICRSEGRLLQTIAGCSAHGDPRDGAGGGAFRVGGFDGTPLPDAHYYRKGKMVRHPARARIALAIEVATGGRRDGHILSPATVAGSTGTARCGFVRRVTPWRRISRGLLIRILALAAIAPPD